MSAIEPARRHLIVLLLVRTGNPIGDVTLRTQASGGPQPRRADSRASTRMCFYPIKCGTRMYKWRAGGASHRARSRHAQLMTGITRADWRAIARRCPRLSVRYAYTSYAPPGRLGKNTSNVFAD